MIEIKSPICKKSVRTNEKVRLCYKRKMNDHQQLKFNELSESFDINDKKHTYLSHSLSLSDHVLCEAVNSSMPRAGPK